MEVCHSAAVIPPPSHGQFSWNHAAFCRVRYGIGARRTVRDQPTLGWLWRNCSISNAENGGLSEDCSRPKKAAADTIQMTRNWHWAMTVSYDGTKYSGWQFQPRAITVQQTIEGVLSQITRCTCDELSLTAASRTDAGVHAWGQVASFSTPFAFEELDTLHYSMNSMLPPDIRIRKVQAVQPDFHVRYHPISKTYQYRAYVGPVMDPFQRSYALHLPFVMNVEAMQEAASFFIGMHNFAAFANSSSKALLSPIRTISKFTVHLPGQHLAFEVVGKSFLYKQVRNMVGLLLEIGKGTLPVSTVSDVLASQNRNVLAKVSSTALGHGLHLMSVDYDEALFLGEPKTSNGRQRKLNERQQYLLASYRSLHT